MINFLKWNFGVFQWNVFNCLICAFFSFFSLVAFFFASRYSPNRGEYCVCVYSFVPPTDLVDTYALDADDYSEELGEVPNMQDTLEADNYEDQLPQPEVICFFFS